MKIPFEFSLRGKDWWKPFIPYWIVYVAYIAITKSKGFTGMSTSDTGGYIVVLLAVSLVYIAVAAVFTIIFLRIFLPKFRAGNKGVEFRGEIGRFLGKVILGLLLSIITVGFYLPWFIRNMAAYLASETRFGGEEPKFLGKPGKLLVYNLLALLLPMLIILGLIVFVVMAGGVYRDGSARNLLLVTIVTFLAVMIILIPYFYLVYRWYANFSCSNVSLYWKTEFWPSCFFILGQLCLTVVTIGVYWPAATLRLYAYFAERTVLERDGAELGRIAFEGRLGKGFGLFWGQSLLCLVTLGFYIPWGGARMLSWTLENSSYVENAEAPTSGGA
jgi:hypothetical protein